MGPSIPCQKFANKVLNAGFIQEGGSRADGTFHIEVFSLFCMVSTIDESKRTLGDGLTKQNGSMRKR